MSTVAEKACADCKAVKPAAEFSPSRVNKSGLFSYCKPCNSRRVIANRNRSPERKAQHNAVERRANIRRYGISVEQYEETLARQNGHCAICGDEMPKPYIDHDHKTGQFRALLCRECNSGLGMFRDRPDALRAAARYLETY